MIPSIRRLHILIPSSQRHIWVPRRRRRYRRRRQRSSNNNIWYRLGLQSSGAQTDRWREANGVRPSRRAGSQRRIRNRTGLAALLLVRHHKRSPRPRISAAQRHSGRVKLLLLLFFRFILAIGRTVPSQRRKRAELRGVQLPSIQPTVINSPPIGGTLNVIDTPRVNQSAQIQKLGLAAGGGVLVGLHICWEQPVAVVRSRRLVVGELTVPPAPEVEEGGYPKEDGGRDSNGDGGDELRGGVFGGVWLGDNERGDVGRKGRKGGRGGRRRWGRVGWEKRRWVGGGTGKWEFG